MASSTVVTGNDSGRRVLVAGVGMTKFTKPSPKTDYPELAKLAIERALADASIPSYSLIEQIVCGYVYGDSTCGQRAVYTVGLTGNVNNNCSTGSSALYIGRQAILSGQVNCVLVVGFEKMASGSLTASNFSDRTNPLDRHLDATSKSFELSATAPFAAQVFGNAGRYHMSRYGTKAEHFAKIAVKNH
jgi:sterol carrier protein 2